MGVSILLCYIRMFGCKNLNTISLIDMTPKLLNDNEWNLGDFDAYDNLGVITPNQNKKYGNTLDRFGLRVARLRFFLRYYLEVYRASRSASEVVEVSRIHGTGLGSRDGKGEKVNGYNVVAKDFNGDGKTELAAIYTDKWKKRDAYKMEN